MTVPNLVPSNVPSSGTKFVTSLVPSNAPSSGTILARKLVPSNAPLSGIIIVPKVGTSPERGRTSAPAEAGRHVLFRRSASSVSVLHLNDQKAAPACVVCFMCSGKVVCAPSEIDFVPVGTYTLSGMYLTSVGDLTLTWIA
jgi:hypothetical protein